MHKIAERGTYYRDAAQYILRHCASPEDKRTVFEVAGWIMRLNLMKFEDLYHALPRTRRNLL